MRPPRSVQEEPILHLLSFFLVFSVLVFVFWVWVWVFIFVVSEN